MSLEWQVNATILLNTFKDCLHPSIMQSCLKTIKALKSISELLFPPFSVLWSRIITGSVKRRIKRGHLGCSQQAQLSLYFFSCHFAFVLCGSRAFTQSFGTEDDCDWEKNNFFQPTLPWDSLHKPFIILLNRNMFQWAIS